MAVSVLSLLYFFFLLQRVFAQSPASAGDSLYSVSINTFQNLTNYHDVQEMNPLLNPNRLKVGMEVVFPLLCKCPNKELEEKGIRYLITYVWQPGNGILAVSSAFNASPVDILTENNYRNFTDAVCLPVLIPVSKLPVILSSLGDPHMTKRLNLIIAILGSAVAFFILSALLVYIHRFYVKRKILETNVSYTEFVESKSGTIEPQIIKSNLLLKVSGCLDNLIIFDEKAIKEATMNLSDRHRIGRSVYKAMINGEVFAVKKFKDVTEEIKILQRLNHANLVKLMGISSWNDEDCFLVYEYAENGSLDNWLFPTSPSSSSSLQFLTWTQRLDIALDVANGLQYMHEHSQPSIVHMDIRTSNILLNSNLKAKISNFYSARPATCSKQLKEDVFAFGVILFELLSGRKAMEQSKNGETVKVWDKLRGVLEVEEKRAERLERWMDQNLLGLYPIDTTLNLLHLANACTLDIYLARPTMTEIVFNLSFLRHSSSEPYEGSWMSGLEPVESSEIFSPIIAR
ncbi:serine/threonine receptor-like kinase NFP [Heracleum sosnowskyi]|uniref:Serine/threonine receptor-like kinase NFP n=1 Tax=Heracleum sosnowskyi TaxID=360622 RepID=A0AAD8MSM3_9APIA|nr:serine/threonine receptor-like kinase NFP [Heracleum sosnowskyi]